VTAPTAPIFVGGLSYSGKTQLRIVLAAHPALVLTRRSAMWDRHPGRYGDLASPEARVRCLAAVAADPAVAPLEPDVDRLRRELATGPASYGRLFGLVHAHAAARAGKRRWGEQLGSVERHAAAIFHGFPHARMVHLVRDPRDRAAEALAGSSRRRRRLVAETDRWSRSAALARENADRFGSGYLVLTHEAFEADPMTTVRAVCAFLGEDFHPDMQWETRALAFRRVPSRRRDERLVERRTAPQLAGFGYPATRAGS
jgi:hypothetical protein